MLSHPVQAGFEMAFLFYFEPVMNTISLNGKILPAFQPALMADNRGYRYGDGLFETMKIIKGKIVLESFHFERLFAGMQLLKYDTTEFASIEKLRSDILALCDKNNCSDLGRVRLSVNSGNGGLLDVDQLQYLIECWPLAESANQLNENGLILGLFPDARKSTDIFSNLKSSSFLPYAMAARFAKANQFDDCLVLNTEGNISDASIANVFIVKDDFFYTPALKDGCVNGVMRRYLLQSLRDHGYRIEEMRLSPSLIMDADELFLTNAIYGIRWVKQFGSKTYGHHQIKEIYNRFVQTIFA